MIVEDEQTRTQLAEEFLDGASGYSAAASHLKRVTAQAQRIEEQLRMKGKNPARSVLWREAQAHADGAEAMFKSILTGWLIDRGHDPNAARVFQFTHEILRQTEG